MFQDCSEFFRISSQKGSLIRLTFGEVHPICSFCRATRALPGSGLMQLNASKVNHGFSDMGLTGHPTTGALGQASWRASPTGLTGLSLPRLGERNETDRRRWEEEPQVYNIT